MNTIPDHLQYLKLAQIQADYPDLLDRAAREQWSHSDFLLRLLETETQARRLRATRRRIQAARIPVPKTLEQFRWDWPKKVNEPLVRHVFTLDFVERRSNVAFLGGVGLGKTHLACALGLAACQAGHSVLFTTAINAINNLLAAQAACRLKSEIAKFTAPRLLIIDELGYLPLDKIGADLFFQIISERYERGSIVITSNKAYKHWTSIFHNDAGITAAVLDRFLHKAETLVIEGKSYRMKDRVEDPIA